MFFRFVNSFFSRINKLRFIGEIEFANWQRNGNGRLIASPTSNIYPITVGEDIMSRETWFTNCEGTWFTTYTTNKFEAKA